MESVKFKREGLLYYLHTMVFRCDPTDTCTYKRNLILTFCILLVTIHVTFLRAISYLFRNVRNTYENQGIKAHLNFMLFTILALVVGIAAIEAWVVIPDFIFWGKLSILGTFGYSFITLLVGVLIIALIIILCAVVVFLLVYSFKGLAWVFSNLISPIVKPIFIKRNGKSNTQLDVIYRSAKEKWCKKINWED